MKKFYLFLLALLTLVTSSTFAQINSTAGGGNWNNPATWVGGVVPNLSNNVVIVSTATVTISSAANAASVTVAGALQFEATTARTLTVVNNVTINAGGTFRSSLTGTQTNHVLSISGSITNNGTLDFSTNGNTAAAGILFTGPGNATFGGTGLTTDINTIEINKGTSITPIVDLVPTNFTVRGLANTPGTGESSFLRITNGTFRIGGTFSATNGVFQDDDLLNTGFIYTVPATGRIWLNNPNYTVSGRNANAVIDGELRVDAGTFNIGTQDGNRLAYQTGTSVVVNGGTVNLASRMTSVLGFGMTYTQTGGTFNVAVVGSSGGSYASFDMRQGDGNSFNMSGGTICVVNSNTSTEDGDPRDYAMTADVVNITGGTIRFGNAGTPTGTAFYMQGTAPGVTIDNSVTGNSLTLQSNVFINGNTNITTGSTLTTAGFAYRQLGNTFTNSGTFDGTAPLSSIVFNGSSTQIINGDGTFTAPVTRFVVLNPGGIAIMNSVPSELNLAELSIAQGNINAGVTTISVGTSVASPGVFTYLDNSSYIIGKFKRWITAATGLRTFPIGTGASKRNVDIDFTTAPTTGGTLTAEWVSAESGTNGLPLTEGSINVNTASSQGYWTVTAGDGLTGGVYTGSFTPTSVTVINDYTRLVLLKRANASSPWILNGTHVTTTGNNTIPVLSRTGMTGFSDFGVGSDQTINPLPITIEIFNGKKQSNNNQLDWKINCTSSPSVMIVLQRGTDGRRFENISTQTATAARCLQPFTYNDATANANRNYYRLQVTDVNGKITYSPVIVILNKEKGFEIVSLMPNLVNTTTVLNVSSAETSRLDLVITDISGKLVQKQSVTLVAGSNQVQLNFGSLSAGAYNISGRTSDGQVKTVRFVKQ